MFCIRLCLSQCTLEEIYGFPSRRGLIEYSDRAGVTELHLAAVAAVAEETAAQKENHSSTQQRRFLEGEQSVLQLAHVLLTSTVPPRSAKSR